MKDDGGSGDEQSESKTPSSRQLVVTPEPDLGALIESGAASLDLRLGSWFLTMRHDRLSHLEIRAGEAVQPSEFELTKLHYVPFGKRFILHPRSFVLAGTLEWIKMPYDLAGYVIGKSSWGRRGLIIATATGVHPYFTGCLTLELSNIGEIPVEIRPGMAICQLFVHETKGGMDKPSEGAFLGFRRPIPRKSKA